MEIAAANGFSAAGEVITCKAAIVWAPGEPLVIQDVEVEPPKKLEVRVKILFTSICHTDLNAWKGDNELQRVYPRILGHEAAGVVESVGEGVEDLRPGDPVVPIFNGECGECAQCKSAVTNLCARYRVDPFKSVMVADAGTRFSAVDADGRRRPVYHFLNTSTFTEYTVLDAACVVKVDPAAPLERMCLLSCGISTGVTSMDSLLKPGVGAAWNTANVTEGSSVAVFGLGAVGLAVAEGARCRKAAKIIGVDINPDKFALGEKMGITEFVNPGDLKKPVHEVIREMTDGGVDFSFECAGNLDVLREAFLSTHDGWGLTVMLGIHPTPRLLPFHPMELFVGRRLVASVFGDFKGKSQLRHLANKCIHGHGAERVNLEGFITHELGFADINRAFELLQQGKALRCMLRFLPSSSS